MGPQSHESPNFGNFGTPTWESLDKMTFGWWWLPLSPGCGESYESVFVCGESCEFVFVCGESYEPVFICGESCEPMFVYGESCEPVFVCGEFMHQRCYNYALTNLLFGLCRFM